MIQITPQMRVLVAIEPVDFRKGIDGLARLCRDELESDPYSGTVFVFRSRGAPTETTRNVLPKDKASKAQPNPKEPKPGHGPRGSKAFPFAARIKVPHPDLKPGDCCPDCPKGHVYPKGKPAIMVRFMGTAPVAATVYERETLRCNACG